MAGLVPFNRNSSIMPSGFEDFYNMLDDFFDKWSPRRSLISDTFKVDVLEKENKYLIEAELPGIAKEEISVEMNEGKLSIRVKREENRKEETKSYIHKERRFSSMQRSIYLADAESDGIKAKLKDGILSINVPKAVRANSIKQINVE